MQRAPGTCLAAVFSLVCALVVAGNVVSGARSLLTTAVQHPADVYIVSLDAKFRRVPSDTLLDLASAWKSSKLVSALSPYSWGPSRIVAPEKTIAGLAGRVEPGWFDQLGVRPSLGRVFQAFDADHCRNCILLSDQLWRVQFAADPKIVGSDVVVDGIPRQVIGVLPPNFRVISSGISLWMLMDNPPLPPSNFVEGIGAVARLKLGVTESQAEADLTDLSQNAGYLLPTSMLQVRSLQSEMRSELASYGLFLLLALACSMLLVFARRRGRRLLSNGPVTSVQRWRWWSFFGVKTLLLLVGTCLVAAIAARYLAIVVAGSILPMAEWLSLWLVLILAVLPLSWSVHDQQQRCRVCLRRLGIPIPIGAPGHVLLNWSGTEMVCSEGHGVLYLRDSENNWLDEDRWNSLDDSWADLFHDEASQLGPPGQEPEE